MNDKIVIINFNRLGDVFQSAHLMRSIKSASPTTEIHYVCYQESKSATSVLKDIDHLHVVPREMITTYYKNHIYSDGLAFNTLIKALQNIKLTRSDRVLNYSNDTVAAYLTSYLCTKYSAKSLGVSFSSLNTVEYSNNFSIVLNDVLTSFAPTPYTFNDCYHQIVGVKDIRTRQSIKTNEKHDQQAFENFKKLRCMKNMQPETTKVIGIQVCSSSLTKDISDESLIELIRLIDEHNNLIPILLVAPTQPEKDRADEINEVFNNTLVSVESDFKALPSVLKNLDLLITPDTSVKHLADLLETKTLEVSLGFAPFLKQGTINPSSVILTLEPSTRNFSESATTDELSIHENKLISGEDIFHYACSMCAELTDIAPSADVIAYRPIRAIDGVMYVPISGNINPSFELRRILSRFCIQKMVHCEMNLNLMKKIIPAFEREELKDFINTEKISLSKVTKSLLTTLRGVVQMQEDKSKNQVFIESLETLLSHCHENRISTVPVLFFRARLESIQSQNISDNLREVEGLIYKLKDSIQACLTVMSQAEKAISDARIIKPSPEATA